VSLPVQIVGNHFSIRILIYVIYVTSLPMKVLGLLVGITPFKKHFDVVYYPDINPGSGTKRKPGGIPVDFIGCLIRSVYTIVP